MERKVSFCAWVRGNADDLDRAVLKDEFSKFGRVIKIFIDSEVTCAKVYFDDLDNLKRACRELNGIYSWEVKFDKDVFYKPKTPLTKNDTFYPRTSNRFVDSEVSSGASNSSIHEDMEEDCTFAEDYVDIHGRSVEVLLAEDGQQYVNLDDVRRAGFGIFKRESFESAIITRDQELREFENYLLNHGMKYLINHKRNFNENEILGTIEKVRAKLQSRSASFAQNSNDSLGQFGEGRLVNSRSSKNFTITKNDVPSMSRFNDNIGSRSPRQLSDSFAPTFSNVKSRVKENRPDGPTNGTRQPYNSFNKNGSWYRNNQFKDKRTMTENHSSYVDDNSTTPLRKPKFSDPVAVDVMSKAVGNSYAAEDPEEPWEGDTTVPQKSTVQRNVQNDTGSTNSDRPSKLSVDRVMLPVGSTVYKAKVSYVKPDKKNVVYVQWMDNMNVVEEILLHVNTEDVNNPEMANPARDMLCVANFEGCWYRAIVLKTDNKTPFVELIDYGNKENIKTPLKEMSDEMKAIPGQAVRLTINQTSISESFTLQADQVIEIVVKKHYDDETHLVEVLNVSDEPITEEDVPYPNSADESIGEVPEPKSAEARAEECFLVIPPALGPIRNDELVIILGYKDNKLILRTRECAAVCKGIYVYMMTVDKQPIKNPKVGQLVLCSRDGMEGLHRAVIKSIDKQVANIEYLDYCGGESLCVKSLRNVDKKLATEPRAVVESPVYEVLKKITNRSGPWISELIVGKKKLKVILNNHKFDLQYTENDRIVLLSETIENLEATPKIEPIKFVESPGPVKTAVKQPSPASKPAPASHPSPVSKPAVASQPSPVSKPAPAPQAEAITSPVVNNDRDVAQRSDYVPVQFDDMPYIKCDRGEDTYFCYTCKQNSLTLVSTKDEHVQYLMDIEINDCDDIVPYEPDVFEMCLAKFNDAWYRAVVSDIDEPTSTFIVLFVDFGNEEKINKSELRKFPEKYAKIPILGMNAYFMGIPEGDPKVTERLQELIPDQSMLIVDVKTDINENFQYGIEIPSVYAILKKEGLI